MTSAQMFRKRWFVRHPGKGTSGHVCLAFACQNIRLFIYAR